MVEMLQMGADRGDPSTIQRMLDTMEKEIARLGRLVRDLLSLSRLDAEQPILLAPVELAPIVSEVSNETRLLATGQDVVSRITATPAVLGDGDRLKQALLNLAANALAFTPSGGHIEFELAQRDGAARLIVSDTGVGIDPAVLPRVMDRFFRADPSRARSTGGSGLGLAIARSIVEAHGGSIALESAPGQGTRAIIELPVAQRATNGHSATRQPSLTGRPG
jgi:signal transduction histidine kinase